MLKICLKKKRLPRHSSAPQFRAQELVQQSARKDFRKWLPHMAVKWSANFVFVACKKEGGGKEGVTDRLPLLEGTKTETENLIHVS